MRERAIARAAVTEVAIEEAAVDALAVEGADAGAVGVLEAVEEDVTADTVVGAAAAGTESFTGIHRF